MIPALKGFFIVVVALYLQGCLITRNDLRTETEKKQSVQFESAKADLQTQITEMQSIIRELNGKVDQLENKVIVEQAEKKEMAQKDAKTTTEKFKLYEEALTSMEKKVEATLKENEALKKEIQINKEKLAALAKLKTTRTRPAKKEKVPKGNYSRGEYYFAKKDWQQAILGYKKYRDLNPNGRRYLEATYKIGVCFQELGLSKEASVFYKEIISKNSKSSYARKAKTRLQALKK